MANSIYSLVVQNRSTQSGSVVLYQTAPDGNPGILSLAWFSKSSQPHTDVVFDWKTDYSFVWSETGRLQPGVMFQPAQNWPADLSSNNAVTFTHQFGNFSFTNQTRGWQEGTLSVRVDSSVPGNQAAVGIGMSGAGTFVAQAQANMNLNFAANSQYWIAFGDYQKGQVLDAGSIANPASLQFSAGSPKLTATLNADNRWTIQRT